MINIVNEHIINERLATQKERGEYFYASEAYLPDNPQDSNCARQLGYKILKYEPTELRMEMYPIFALGDLYHEFIQRIFVKEKLAKVVEECDIIYDDDGKQYWIRKDTNKIIFKDELEIHGRLDLQFDLLKESFVADIKTISEKSWKYLNGPKESHYAQVQIYLQEKKCNRGFILYINKSTGEMKEFMLEYDKEYLEKYLANYKKLFNFIREVGLPQRHFKSGAEVPWQCRYCDFTKTCLGVSVSELENKYTLTYPEGKPGE